MDEQQAWDIYFASLAGWQFHPGYHRDNATRPTLDELARTATHMIMQRRKIWPDGQQQQVSQVA